MKQLISFSIILLFITYAFGQEQVKELSLQDAIKSALEHNLDLVVEKYNPDIASTQVSFQKGVFLPVFFSTIQNISSKQIASSEFQSGSPTMINKDFIYNFGINYLNPYGTNINVSFKNDRYFSNSILINYNPFYTSFFEVTVSQPLLENFGKENTQYLVIKSENNKKIYDLAYQQKILDTLLATQNAYWDIVFTYENYKVKLESTELAKKLLQETEARVAEGDAAEIEGLAAKAEVAKREEELIAAEDFIERAENILKALIEGSADPNSLMYRIHPTDTPQFKEFPLELNSLIDTAMKNRPDLSIADTVITLNTIDEKHFKNALLPSLNLKLGAGLNGLGGDYLIFQGPILQWEIVGKIPGGYGDALSKLFGGTYHDWNIGLEFKYPIFNQQDKANYSKAQLAKSQSIASQTRLKQRIVLEIKNSAKDIQLNYKRIEAAKITAELMSEKLKAEEEKLKEGLSTNYYVLTYQEDLARAKSNELAALISYNKSIAQLQHAIGLNEREIGR